MTSAVPPVAELLRDLAEHRYPKEHIGNVAMKHGLTVDELRDIVTRYGYPERDKMLWALDEMNKPKQVTAKTHEGRWETFRRDTRTPQAGVEQLLDRGDKSTKARSRKLADRARALLGELQQLVDEETAAAAAAEAEAKRKAELQAEVDRLEAELAAKKAALRGQTPSATKTRSGGAAKAMRAWALEHGVDCPSRGRVPAAVAEAYHAANRKRAS